MYAKYLCGYDSTKCGGTDYTSTLSEGGEKTYTIANLNAGGSCFYVVKSSCAAPAFTVSTTAADGSYDVEFIEFTSSAIDSAAGSSPTAYTVASSDATWKTTAPMTDAPPRGTRFANA